MAERSAPVPADHPIDHVVVIIQENTTWDRNYTWLGRGDGDDTLPVADPKHPYPFPWEPTHGHHWSANHADISDRRERLSPEDIPLYAESATKFQYPVFPMHAAVDTSSWCNHASLFFCASGDRDKIDPQTGKMIGEAIENRPPGKFLQWLDQKFRSAPPSWDITTPSICDRIEEAGLTWANCGDGVTQFSAALRDSVNNLPSASFETLAREGKLPTLTFLHPEMFAQSEHAPDHPSIGMEWVFKQLEAIASVPGQWEKTLVIQVYDDSGGFHDHVKPPLYQAWDRDQTQHYSVGKRVPCLLWGAWTKPGYVPETDMQMNFYSVPATIERLFGLAPLNERDACARDLLDCLDFTQKPMTPPRTRLTGPEQIKMNELRHQRVKVRELYPAVVENLWKMEAIPLRMLSTAVRPHFRRLSEGLRSAFSLDDIKLAPHSRNGIGSKTLRPGNMVLRGLNVAAGVVATAVSWIGFQMFYGGAFQLDHAAGLEMDRRLMRRHQQIHGTADPIEIAKKFKDVGPEHASRVARETLARRRMGKGL